MRIAVTNLRKYNEGVLEYKWIELGEIDNEDIKEQINEFLENDEEWFVSDYEAPFNISEYPNVDEINYLAELIKLADLPKDVIKNICHFTDEKEYVIEVLESEDLMYIEKVNTTKDLGEAVIYEMDFYDIPQELEGFIDYESLGRHWERYISYPFNIKYGVAVRLLL